MVAILGANGYEIGTVIGIIPGLETCGSNAVFVLKFILHGVEYDIVKRNNEIISGIENVFYFFEYIQKKETR